MFYRILKIKFLTQYQVYVRSDGKISLDGVTYTRGDKYNSTSTKKTKKHYYRIKNHFGYCDLLVHRLVAIAFCENPSPTYFRIVDHINGDSLCNHSWNLRWINHTLNNLNSFTRNTKRRMNGMYYGCVKVNKKPYYTKTFRDEYDAYIAAQQLKYDLFRENYRACIENANDTTRYCEHIYGRECISPVAAQFNDLDVRRPVFCN